MTANVSTTQRPRLLFAYKFGLLGGVVAQLRNRLDTFARSYDMRFLFQEDHGVRRLLPEEHVKVASRRADAIEFFQAWEPDYVVVIDSPWFIPAWREAGRPGKLVVEVHTTTTNIRYLGDLTASDGVARFVTISEYMRHRLLEWGVDQLADIAVVPNCLSPVWRCENPAPVADVAPLLWVGKLDGHKRWRMALDIMEAAMRQSVSNGYAPLMVGGYTAGEQRVRSLLARLARSRPLGDAAWWPNVPYEMMPTIYRSAGLSGGLTLSASRDESFGMSVAESLAMGCPVVAPRVGALPELLPTEAMYEPHDVHGGAKLLSRAMSDRNFREALLSTRDDITARTHPEVALERYEAALVGL